jgi:hypothetical protein
MVSYTKNSPVCQRQLEIMHGARDANAVEIGLEIEKMVPKVVDLMNGTLDNENDPLHLRLKVAFEVLDRVAPKVTRTQAEVAHFTAEDIERIKARGRAQAAQTGSLLPGPAASPE